jgi:predicted ATPase
MMVEQPSGTVTLVFTDIEGSTRLLHELGEREYREALAGHRGVVREACGRHGGYEVDYEGDSFFYAFRSASEAVAAAQESMRGLEDGPIRIRVGIHTGEPGLDPPKYVGLDVHMAARVMAAGHGGQVVLTSATRELVDTPLRDLGEHRLKDFERPVALYQLGEHPFPPLKTIANTNLPRPASSFIGREHEIREVMSLLSSSRLVTLLGAGGSGKTRLAIEAAAELIGEFRAGVFFVGMAGLREPALVLATIAQTLGASADLASHIEGRELLLLIDNFEQVVEAAPDLARLVEACPNLRLIVTSRELLRVQGEVSYEVAPLAPHDAVMLFCTRAQVEDAPAVAELCGRLDDLPLALELAAARARVLAPDQILERLGERLDLLRGGRDADPRQQTLRATIDWSHSLLTPDEQRLFARLSVFPGGCTLDAAASVCDATLDTLQSLVEKSLLRQSSERFWMLETIREYASERLEASSEAEPMRRRQAEFLLGIANIAGFARDATTPERHDLVRAELTNVRAALAWTVNADVELGVRLVCELHGFWVSMDPIEGHRWLEKLLAQADGIPDDLMGLALKSCANFAGMAGEVADSTRYIERALEHYRRLGDERSILSMQPGFALHVAFYADEPDLERARALCEESLAAFRRSKSVRDEAAALQILAYIEQAEGNFDNALKLALEAASLAEKVGWTWWRIAGLESASQSLLSLNRPREAAEYARQCLLLAHPTGDRRSITTGLARLAAAAAANEDPERAGQLWGAIEAEAERGRIGQWEAEYRDKLAHELLHVAGPAFERGVAEGKALTLDQAIDFALSGIGDAQETGRVPVSASQGAEQ